MAHTIAVMLLAGLMFSTAASAQNDAPEPILPDSIRWEDPPNITKMQAAWVVGAEQEPGPYLLRVRLASGARIPPHTHPDKRISTVLSGVIYVGFGETFDETAVVAVPTGAVYVAPTGVPHYIWAEENAMYQEVGVGPTGTSFVNR